MHRSELVEWLVIIGCILLWWPRIFLPIFHIHFDPLWYHVIIYYIVPVVLIVITVRRYRRMRQGLDYSEELMKAQRGGPPNVAPPGADRNGG